MQTTRQPDLPLFTPMPSDKHVEALVELLRGRGWMTAREILAAVRRPDTEANRRWLRSYANASGGQIASGQAGYKLVREMTGEEYNHYRNWMKSQADEMTARILRSDKVFYARQPVESGNGILQP